MARPTCQAQVLVPCNMDTTSTTTTTTATMDNTTTTTMVGMEGLDECLEGMDGWMDGWMSGVE